MTTPEDQENGPATIPSSYKTESISRSRQKLNEQIENLARLIETASEKNAANTQTERDNRFKEQLQTTVEKDVLLRTKRLLEEARAATSDSTVAKKTGEASRLYEQFIKEERRKEEKRRGDLRSQIVSARRRLPDAHPNILPFERLKEVAGDPKTTIENLEEILKNIRRALKEDAENATEEEEARAGLTRTTEEVEEKTKGVHEEGGSSPSQVTHDVGEGIPLEDKPLFYSPADPRAQLLKEKEPEKRIAEAQNFDELLWAIKNMPEIPEGFSHFGTAITVEGRRGRYGKKGFEELIEAVREGKKEIREIPNTYGIRDKVHELLVRSVRGEAEAAETVPRGGEGRSDVPREDTVPETGPEQESPARKSVFSPETERKMRATEKKWKDLLERQAKEEGATRENAYGEALEHFVKEEDAAASTLSPAQQEEQRVRATEQTGAAAAAARESAVEAAIPSPEAESAIEPKATVTKDEDPHEVVPVASDMRTITDKLFAKRNIFGIPIRGYGAKSEKWAALRNLKAYDVMQTDAGAFLETIDAQKRETAKLTQDDIGELQTELDRLFRESGERAPSDEENETIEEYMKRALRKKKSAA